MKNPKIVIIDYGVGNTHSVYNSIKYLGYKKILISDISSDISKSDVIILPGVGAFETCIKNLKDRGLDKLLNNQVLINKKPILGICVGMQLLATSSEENGNHTGLGWIDGVVKKLIIPSKYSVPHVGWNDVQFNHKSPLFSNIDQNTNFYFDHSYHFDCNNNNNIVGVCDYGIKVTAAVQKDNIFGVQFHPEKSQTSGLKLFRGFLNSI
jgi:glutamine amidotransferase